MEPKYLGDGVYISMENGIVVLTTGHHSPNQATNTIFLEPEQVINLVKALAEIPIPAQA